MADGIGLVSEIDFTIFAPNNTPIGNTAHLLDFFKCYVLVVIFGRITVVNIHGYRIVYRMKNVNIKARIRRNKFDELAGEYYQDENSEIVKYLNNRNKKALLGIKRPDGVYTIIGETSVYYVTELGKEGEISHSDFLKILRENAMAKGKKGQFDFVQVNQQDYVWLLNGGAMNAMWNTIMLLDNNNKATK